MLSHAHFAPCAFVVLFCYLLSAFSLVCLFVLSLHWLVVLGTDIHPLHACMLRSRNESSLFLFFVPIWCVSRDWKSFSHINSIVRERATWLRKKERKKKRIIGRIHPHPLSQSTSTSATWYSHTEIHAPFPVPFLYLCSLSFSPWWLSSSVSPKGCTLTFGLWLFLIPKRSIWSHGR